MELRTTLFRWLKVAVPAWILMYGLAHVGVSALPMMLVGAVSGVSATIYATHRSKAQIIDEQIKSGEKTLDDFPVWREIDWDKFGKTVDTYLEVGAHETEQKYGEVMPFEIEVPAAEILYRMERDMSVTCPENLQWECSNCHHRFSRPMNPCPLCEAPLKDEEYWAPQVTRIAEGGPEAILTRGSESSLGWSTEDRHAGFRSRDDSMDHLLKTGDRFAGVGPAQLTFAVHRDVIVEYDDLEHASRMTITNAMKYLKSRYPNIHVTHSQSDFSGDSRYHHYNLQPDEESPPWRTLDSFSYSFIERSLRNGTITVNEARRLLSELQPPAPVAPSAIAESAAADAADQDDDRRDDADDRRQSDQDTQPVDESCQQNSDENANH